MSKPDIRMTNQEHPTGAVRFIGVCFLILWLCFIVLYAAGFGALRSILISTGGGYKVQLLSDDFVRDKLAGPLEYTRSDLRGVHIGRVARFADRLHTDLPEDATIYLQFDLTGHPPEATTEQLHSICFDNYAYAVDRLFPRRVYVTTPGRAIRDPVFFPEGLRLKAGQPTPEEIGLPRSVDWLRAHGFDYHVIYDPYTGVGRFGRVPAE